MNPFLYFGIQLIQAIQVLSPALDGLMNLISFLGTIEGYLILIPLIYWVFDSRLAMQALLLLITTDILGTAFKHLLHQPRPYWVGDVKILATEVSYGIPSTHSSNSLAFWGYLAYRFRKNWLWIVSGVLIFLIGLSRMYLGVHFPQDVLGGWLLGTIVAYLFVRLEPWVLQTLRGYSARSVIGISFGISIAVLILGLVVRLLIANSPDPVEWAEYALLSRSPANYFTLGGALFGAITGYILMQEHARFQTRGTPLQKVARYVLGVASVLIVYVGLDFLFSLIAADDTILGYALRYVRYAIVTFWMSFGAPWLFLKTRLAEPGIPN